MEGEAPEVIGICRCIYYTTILNTIFTQNAIQREVKHIYVKRVYMTFKLTQGQLRAGRSFHKYLDWGTFAYKLKLHKNHIFAKVGGNFH